MLTVDPAIAAHRRHYPSVSLLVPIDGPTPWPARLRRLQREANLRLLAEFDGNPDRRLLAHLDDAAVNAEAPHGARSLAVYASSEGCDWVGLAVHVRERVVVDDLVDELIEIVLSRQGRLEIVPDGTLATHQRIALVPVRKGKR